MKSLLIGKLLITSILFSQLIFIKPTYALDIRYKSDYLFDIRGDDGDLYSDNISIYKKFDPYEIETALFGTVQWNIQTSEWEKLLLGADISKYLWKYLYIGQSIQLISGQILDHMTFNVNSKSFDATTKIGLDIPLLKKISLQIFEEYSLNLEEGYGGYCESWAKLIYKPKDIYSFGIGWHHTDRIHNFDSDYVSLSMALNF